jgi:hypothetical protein
MKNSRGANKLLSIYWFFILVIVSGGIVLMVNSFYSTPYDVREVEAEILSKNVLNCFMTGGKISPNVMSNNGVFLESFQDHFNDICNLSFDVYSEFERPQYYVEVDFYDFGNLRDSRFLVAYGNNNWKSDCNFENSKEEKIAKCVQKEVFVQGVDSRLYLVKILTIVGKTEENVK